MKSKKTEIEFDFIGGESVLTVDEEKALSSFFKQRRQTAKKTVLTTQPKKTKRPRVTS